MVRLVLLAQAVAQVLQEQVEQAVLLEQAAKLEFQQGKFITLINPFQVELAHIKNYQLIQVVQLNRLFLKRLLVVLQF
jgi:hypothetical protein